MAKLTMEEAAEAVGKTRSTIWRATKNGTLSSEKNEQGVAVIDAAELARVYPISKAWLKKQEASSDDDAMSVAQHGADATGETARNVGRNTELATELKFMRERILDRDQLHDRERTMLNVRIEELRADKDGFARERDAWAKERDGLIATLKDMGATMKMLTDQRPITPPSSTEPLLATQVSRRGVFGWLRRS